MLLWSFGMVLPAAHAATIADGDLVKTADSSAVYYIQGANKRVFPHYNVYLSWGYPADFSTVKTVSASELAAYTDDNAMPFRDGSLFRGTTTSLGGKDATAVFYVENAKLRPVLSEQVYQGLFNDPNWSRVTWVPDDLLTKFNYEMGADLTTSATHPNGCIVKYTGTTQKYLIENGQKRAISDAAFSANRYLADSVITIDTDEVYADGSPITGVESGLLTPGWVAATGATTSALTVSLDSSNPAGDTLPNKATNIPLLKVRLTAGSSVVTVTGLTFKRMGVGAVGDWADGLYLYEGSDRITSSARSLSSDEQNVEFAALSVAIPANSSKVITLRGDLAANATANDEHTFQLTAVETTATVNGLPLTGNKFVVGQANVGTVTHTLVGGDTLSNPTVGQAGAEIYSFKLAADSSHDCSLDQIVLTKGGTISSSNVTNIKLYQGSTVLATASTFASNDTVTLTPSSPFNITKGKNKTFSVKADLGGKRGDTLTIKLEEDSHLVASDLFYSYGALIDGVNTTQAITLQGGDVTLSFNGPSATDISQNASDVTLMKFAITSEAKVDIKKIKVTLTLGGTADQADEIDIKDLRIKDADTGSTLMGPYDWTEDDEDNDSIVKTFNTAFTVAANTTRNLKVTVDTDDNAVDGMTVKAKVEIPVESGSGTTETRQIKDLDSNLYVLTTNVVPTSLTGYDMTVKASSLTVTKASIPVSKTTVTGTSDVESFAINLTAGSASGIKVTKLIAKIIGTATTISPGDTWTAGGGVTVNNARDYVNTVDLYDGATKLGTANLVAGTGESTLTYDNLSLNVPKNGNKKLTFKANIKSGLKTQVYYYIDVDQANITAYDDDDVSRTPSAGLKNTTTPSVVVTVATTGTLTVAADSSTPDETLMVAGTTGNVVSKIKFTATNEAFTVKELKVLLQNGTANNYDRSVTQVAINYGSTTITGTLSPDGNDSSASFTGLSINVPKDDSTIVTIKADLNTITGGAVSGDVIKLGFDTVYKAVSASGTTATTLAAAAVYGNPMVLHKTIPTITQVAVSNTTLANAEMELYKFNIAADANEDVALKQIAFDVTLSEDDDSDMSVGTLAFYRGGTKLTDVYINIGETTSTDATIDEGDSVVVVSWKDNKEEVISKGTNQTYTLKGVVAGTDTGDSMMVRIAEENTTTHEIGQVTYSGVAGTYLKIGANYRKLIWSDYYKGVSHTAYNQGAGVGTASADWINGYKVETLPSTYSVLSR